jgi:anti-anti-sigma factor
MSDHKFVRTDQQGETLIVTPLFTYASFAESDVTNEWIAVQRLVETPAVRNVVVNLGEIPYFGSTVLEWMVQLWKRIKVKGGRLAACKASPIGCEVLRAANFDKLWGLHGSQVDALAAVHGPATVHNPAK